MDAPNPVRIAFVCTGNTGRSVAAEALAMVIIAKDHLNARVISCGVNRNPHEIHPETNFVTLFRERGIDLSPHVAAQFDARDAAFSDLILTMTRVQKTWVMGHFPEASDRVFTIAEYATGQPRDVLDAFGQPMAFYKQVLGDLDQLVAAAVVKATKQ